MYQRAFGVVAEEKLVTKGAGIPTDWTRDGRHLIYDKGGDPWALPLTGDRKPFQVTETPFTELGGRVSPDGHWIAYYSTESSRDNQAYQVYIQSFPERGLKQLVSTNGGYQLRWSRDGKGFFYIARDLTLMAVSISQMALPWRSACPLRCLRCPSPLILAAAGITTSLPTDGSSSTSPITLRQLRQPLLSMSRLTGRRG